jgi:branched-chain amino acid aminotransferase
MGIESDYVWKDGQLVPFAEATVHALAHGLHYGMGAFEGIRAYTQPDGTAGIWRLGTHLRRLVDTVRMMRLECPYTEDELREACLDVLDANRFTEAYLRPIVFTGAGSMGLGARDNPIHVVIGAWHWASYLSPDAVDRGIRLKTSTFVRHHPNAALQRAKISGNYVNNVLARYEATDDGYDEAVMLDHAGHVAEGTGENLFVARDGVVFTPPAVNVLPGVTRRSVLDILRVAGIEVREQMFGRDGMYVADEVWLCGTAAEITPVREIDRRALRVAPPGPITRLVKDTYAAGVRGHVDWMRRDITSRTTEAAAAAR